jgi:hypothetical protein
MRYGEWGIGDGGWDIPYTVAVGDGSQCSRLFFSPIPDPPFPIPDPPKLQGMRDHSR